MYTQKEASGVPQTGFLIFSPAVNPHEDTRVTWSTVKFNLFGMPLNDLLTSGGYLFEWSVGSSSQTHGNFFFFFTCVLVMGMEIK